MTDSPVRAIDARTLKSMVQDGGEIAVLDAREEGVFSERHLLLACSLPLSHVETRAATLVPRPDTRIVVCDAGEGVAERAARRLGELGYTDIAVLDGGIEAWGAAGYELYSGVNVPSKAFGEFVEHQENTPRMTAEEIQSLRDSGTDMIILDSRPIAEFQRMNIPGAIDCPGAELVFRTPGLVPSPDTLVVVNCAGRTRSIIGAQSLINAGLPNKVVALKDGTMGWHLAGFELERGQDRRAPRPEGEGLERALAAAERVAERFGVKTIDHAGLQALRDEPGRTVFLLDVRDPDEFAAGHLPGSRSAPGGQLVQATDTYVGVRNARIVLADDHGVRSRMTASWLIQMGWNDVHVLDDVLSGQNLQSGADAPPVLGLDGAKAMAVEPDGLSALLAAGQASVVDLASSLAFRAGHVPGAWFAVRSHLPQNLNEVPGDGPLVFTSADGVLARFAATDMTAALPDRPVRYLAGGTAAWQAAGLPLEAGDERLGDAVNDVAYKAYDHKSGVEDRMKAYLDWEVALVEQIARDDDAKFHSFPRN